MKPSKLEIFTKLRDMSRSKKDTVEKYRMIYEGLEQTGTLDINYADNLGDRSGYELAAHAERLSFKDCCTVLTFLMRAEHWTPGAFDDALQSGNIYSLLNRAVETLTAKEAK